jgi:DNA-binding FadR family transcriptional regulator
VARQTSSSAFRPIDIPRGWEEAVAQIREAVVERRLRPGDRLPAQRELAIEMGVSRALVNEALRVLEHSGLVEIRKGSKGGAFIRAPVPDDLVQSVGLLVSLGTVKVDQLTDFRLVLEGQNAAWAARRASRHQVARLWAIVDDVRRIERHEPNAIALNDADVEFHVAVAEAAGNELSLAAVRGISPSLRKLTGLVPIDQAGTAARHLEKVTESIANHQGHSARKFMQEHIRYFADVLGVRGS